MGCHFGMVFFGFTTRFARDAEEAEKRISPKHEKNVSRTGAKKKTFLDRINRIDRI